MAVAIRQCGVLGVLVVLVLVEVAAGAIITPRFSEWLSAPFMPVTCSENEPVDDEDEAVSESVEVAGVPLEGVTGPGRLAVTPLGAEPVQE